MSQFIDRLISFFAVPQGNLIYFLILGILVFAAFQSNLYANGNQVSIRGERIQKALLYLLLTQMVLFTISWVAWVGIIEDHISLPPLERTAALFSLVLIIWLWVFPDPIKVVDRFVFGLETGILFSGVYSLLWWSGRNVDSPFNLSLVGAYAYYLGIFLLILGLCLLAWMRPDTWRFGALMFAIMLVGYASQYLLPQPAGDVPWLVRMGEIASYSILLALPRRLLPWKPLSELSGRGKPIATSVPLDIQLLKSALYMTIEIAPQKYYQSIAWWLAHYMKADICVLLFPPKNGREIIVALGYSVQNDHYKDGFTIDGRRMPTLFEALQKGNSLTMIMPDADSEINVLTHELALAKSSQLLFVPFAAKDSSTSIGFVLLSNDTSPTWTETDSSRLLAALEVLLVRKPLIENQTSLDALVAEVKKSKQVYGQIKAQNEALSAELTQSPSISAEIAALSESQKSLQELVRYLGDRNRELEALVSMNRPSMDEVDELRLELRAALTDLARIPTALSKSDQRMLDLQLSTMKHLDDMGRAELVTGFSQEFRQPLSSIIGYTDLLLGESVGILGATQRKFLEKVKVSTDRMSTLIDDLVHIVAIDASEVDKTLVNIDMEAIIDDAVGDIITQISDKNITLRVDLPEKVPAIQANKDALRQILTNLLQNACLATPPEGVIRLFTSIEKKQNEPTYLLISVTDQGGGIASSDVPRIFSRQYKEENQPIPGIGDTSVGLSIVKSLIELQKGRIWVDSKEGVGSTFSCVIPIIVNLSDDNRQDPS